MKRRLVVGLIKGLVLGVGLGAAFQIGAGWGKTDGLLGYLLAMGISASIAVVSGRSPWHTGAWIEAALKAVAGLCLGALAYWVASSYAAIPLPFGTPNAPVPTPWTSQPMFFGTALGVLFGPLIELDNTPKGGDKPKHVGGVKVPKEVWDDEQVKG